MGHKERGLAGVLFNDRNTFSFKEKDMNAKR